ncbi:uncharacterized protein CTRU02_208415 [Colletotrichum truncatum]|uniref:Uncharacterized protein n=1 Tax=Colletotrichum truncatum TaxID=5467 RepID=A0ACC3YWA5_COLTU|nr:uncharacterized protein CTRU02_10167 [Colletotrichum truncatum]KAF6787371.1 hypothetical protein CTRU02_10167 [Colletotrichum truncatum]
MLRRNDPEYALTNAKWCNRNLKAKQYNDAYKIASSSALTKVLKKVRADGSRPAIAPRELQDPYAIPTTCAPGSADKRDVDLDVQKEFDVFVNKDGEEYVEYWSSDNVDFSLLGQLPALSVSREAKTIATTVVYIEE